MAAFSGALIVGFQICLTHWHYLYIPWFMPFVALALLAPRTSTAEEAVVLAEEPVAEPAAGSGDGSRGAGGASGRRGRRRCLRRLALQQVDGLPGSFARSPATFDGTHLGDRPTTPGLDVHERHEREKDADRCGKHHLAAACSGRRTELLHRIDTGARGAISAGA